MKRRIVVAGIGVALGLASCHAPAERSGGDQAPQEGGWMATPRITSVERQGAGVIVRGDAPPDARVVLRGDQDTAFGAGADAAGRFDVRVGVLTSPLLLTPEVQIGQFPAPGPEQLLLVGEGRLLAATLIEGGASRRLSAGPALDSVDGDGKGVLLSGRAAPGALLSVSGGGGAAVEVNVDASGRWTAALTNIGDHPTRIQVGDASFAYPGPTEGAAVGRIERAGEGWRLTRTLSSSARQTSWFPDP